jgi:hypothetical protein
MPFTVKIYFLIILLYNFSHESANRVRKLINLDIKKTIISKRENGKSVWYLIAEYGMAKSTISTIKKTTKQMVVLDGNFALGCGPGTDYP